MDLVVKKNHQQGGAEQLPFAVVFEATLNQGLDRGRGSLWSYAGQLLFQCLGQLPQLGGCQRAGVPQPAPDQLNLPGGCCCGRASQAGDQQPLMGQAPALPQGGFTLGFTRRTVQSWRAGQGGFPLTAVA